MRYSSASCVLLLVALVACSRHADQKPPVHSTASVIVEQPSVAPGSRVNVGIRFVMDKGWHIYWQNPGDSGEPPRMRWRIPAGVTTGTLAWPTPTRLKTAAGTDYGYEGTTVLLSTLQFASTMKPGTTVELGGDLRWLACRDICVPQRVELKTPVRIASTAQSDDASRRLLQSAAERIPNPLSASFRPSVSSSPDSFALRFFSTGPVTQAEFFPSDEEQLDNAAPQKLTARGSETMLTLKNSEQLRHAPERLKGVLVLNGREAYQIDVPVTSLASAQKRR